MLKRFFLIPVISFLFLSIVGCAKEAPVTAQSAILMSPLTKRIVYSKDPHARLLPASTVKIMTALAVLKNSLPKKRVAVSRFASSMEPSKVYIKENEVYFTEDLLKALLLNSGNDASVALAESVAGSEEKFVNMINDMARTAGARDTNFKNSNGLPTKDQYSTAYDLAVIVRTAMRDKRFIDIIKTKRSEIEEIKSGRRIKLKNHNKSLWKDKAYSIFGKTGYTKKARHCFAGYIEYSWWRRVIVVILKSEEIWSDLDALAESLL